MNSILTLLFLGAAAWFITHGITAFILNRPYDAEYSAGRNDTRDFWIPFLMTGSLLVITFAAVFTAIQQSSAMHFAVIFIVLLAIALLLIIWHATHLSTDKLPALAFGALAGWSFGWLAACAFTSSDFPFRHWLITSCSLTVSSIFLTLQVLAPWRVWFYQQSDYQGVYRIFLVQMDLEQRFSLRTLRAPYLVPIAVFVGSSVSLRACNAILTSNNGINRIDPAPDYGANLALGVGTTAVVVVFAVLLVDCLVLFLAKRHSLTYQFASIHWKTHEIAANMRASAIDLFVSLLMTSVLCAAYWYVFRFPLALNS